MDMTLRAAGAALLAMCGTALAEPAVPVFTDETAVSGFSHSFTGGWEFMVGGGAAVFDCSGDGLPEILAAGGDSPAALFRNAGRPGGQLIFERSRAGSRSPAWRGHTRSTSTGTG
jgi:enediyne biosynthesis protein E4